MDLSSMSQKFKKFAGSASTTINRAVQFTEEKLGSAEKTELDAHFENLLQRSDKTRIWTERVLKGTECVIQPNPNQRMEDMMYEKLEKKKKDRMTSSESLGQHMVDAGNDFGPGTSYGNALIKSGQAQMRIGNAEREYVQSTVNNFLTPLKNFLEGDMKTIMKERKLLENKRLDLDACKSRLRKAKSTTAQQQTSPEASYDDVIAKAEADLRVAQSEFDRQAEITKILLEGVNSTHAHHLRCLNDFIEAQGNFYAQCSQYIRDLQSQLGSVSAATPPSGDMDYSVGSATSMGGGAPSNMHSSSVPNSNSPLMPSAPPAIQVTAPTPTEKKQARVLYDYDAADSTELSLLADELIMVYKVAGLDDDWLMAERGSQRGKVPVTYLEVLE
ncbi:endophilin-B1-like isoform X2 [Haliotis cracherodii]|uniref:endophilin-B1-like isoform X3 n=1 Tax=Haliotis rufescens TaxID=6454 RepID=UPI001EAFDC1C|nr:endophilin-B1-like isoform X3 [Haliotis rufescens]